MGRTKVLRLVHDVSLAAWFGGAWMGAVGLNGATTEVDDHTQRTRVANAGWFRWAPVVGMSVVLHTVAASMRGRLRPAIGAEPARLAGMRTGLTLVALAATAETGVSGQRVVRAGDVPVASATRPIAATPADVAAAQARLRLAQWAVPAATALLWVVESLQSDD